MERKIAVVGLGYVGLPVAVAFGNQKRVLGFDIQTSRVEELRNGLDKNGEVSKEELSQSKLVLSDQPEDLKWADFFIVAVPTPVNEAHQPDLTILRNASALVGEHLKKGDIVVYESTVYPGATEEDCVPILEKASGLKCGPDFKVGYSPERINPGDREHSFTKIKKVVSAQDAESLKIVSALYGSVVEAGIHEAPSIKVAEAAKVIENTQRDLNIALMNELALVFEKIGIDTQAVLAAANTKWNFLPFSPGLVGGHCIGVDPYYLTYQAERYGYIPQVILSGRRVNDSMGRYVAQRMVKEIIRAGNQLQNSKVTVLGITFKENCPDLRNSRVVDIIRELESFGLNVQVHDPLVSAEAAHEESGIHLTPWEQLKPSVGVVVAVGHRQYKELKAHDLKRIMSGTPVLGDVKGLFSSSELSNAGIRFWRL